MIMNNLREFWISPGNRITQYRGCMTLDMHHGVLSLLVTGSEQGTNMATSVFL